MGRRVRVRARGRATNRGGKRRWFGPWSGEERGSGALGRHRLALLHERPLLVSQVIGSEHGGRPLLDLLHLSAGRVRVLVQVNGRPSPLAQTPRRTTAGGAASARGGAMSKLPELSASARAAAAAPLATDRLGPAMLMTGAFVSDATRGAPGRRVRRMRCAKSCGAGC